MRHRLTLVAGWTGRIVLWLIILSAAGALLVAVLIPRVAGATPYAVLTGSMQPTLAPGTLVVARPVPADRIGVGTVITYQLESGRPAVVTHRVVAQGIDGQGQPLFRTQGDANDTPDERWVQPVQVKGAEWYAVPYLGFLSMLLNGAQRQLLVYVVAGALLVYAMIMFAGAVCDRRRRAVA